MQKYKQIFRGKIIPDKNKIKEAEASLAATQREFLKLFPKDRWHYIKNHTYFAGGCIYSLYNSKAVSDYDVFCDSKHCVELLSSLIGKQENLNGYTKSFETSNAISLTGDCEFQIIKKWYGEPSEVVAEFDFYHNHFAFIKGKIISFYNWRYIDVKKLCFNFKRGRDIVNVLLRIPKFIKKGFWIYEQDHLKIIEMALNNSAEELKSIKTTKEHY